MTSLTTASSSDLVHELESRGYLVVENAKNEDVGLKFLRDFCREYKRRTPFGKNYQRFMGVLVSRLGKTTSYKTLITAIWGDDPDGGPGETQKNIQVMVCRLRKVFDGTPYRIETVWGFGIIFLDTREEHFDANGAAVDLEGHDEVGEAA